MPDPMVVTVAQLRASYDALGLDPDRFDEVKSISSDPSGITIVRVRVDEQGHAVLLTDGSDVATETVTIAVQDSDLAPDDGNG